MRTLMRTLLVLMCLSFFVVSCGGYREGIIQKREVSYLKFVGDPEDVTVVLDDDPPFALKRTANVLYEVSPGRHQIEVYRKGKIVVNRILLLDDQVTKEVNIP